MATDWEGTATAYARSFGRLCAGTIPFLMSRALSFAPGARALDAGTGTGSVAAAMSSAGFHAHGCDADAEMVDLATKRVPDATFSIAALPTLTFDDDAFDLTIANFVINHVAKPREGIRELHRVTATGGLLLVTIWPARPVSLMNEMWNRVIEASGIDAPAGSRLPEEDDFERDQNGLGRLLTDAGLSEIEVSEITWDFTINAEDLWAAVEAGIAGVGAVYRGQGVEGRQAMRSSYEDMTGLGDLTLPSTALMASGRAR